MFIKEVLEYLNLVVFIFVILLFLIFKVIWWVCILLILDYKDLSMVIF